MAQQVKLNTYAPKYYFEGKIVPGIPMFGMDKTKTQGDEFPTAAGLPPDAGCAPHERIIRIPRKLLVQAKADIPDKL